MCGESALRLILALRVAEGCDWSHGFEQAGLNRPRRERIDSHPRFGAVFRLLESENSFGDRRRSVTSPAASRQRSDQELQQKISRTSKGKSYILQDKYPL